MSKDISDEQRKKWFLNSRCHVCGSNEPHDHPQWMWLANSVPKLSKDEGTDDQRELADIQEKIDTAVLENIVGGKLKKI